MDGDGLAIRTTGLVKSYALRRALDGLDLVVPRGVVYGFLGLAYVVVAIGVAALFATRTDVP